ncbi:MAG: hypothetical protein K0R82_697 [Flavipsychrobacter sp.]|jgi:hypothetical protein|nr:hypothetical protein [Flavipsychrobacter sp.]
MSKKALLCCYLEISISFLILVFENQMSMKKLYAIALIAVCFTACEKKQVRHCWVCNYTQTTTDPKLLSTTTTADTIKHCDMTEEELRQWESRYKARELNGVKYSDAKCSQLPDEENEDK